MFAGNKTSSENIVFEANSAINKQTKVKAMLVDIEGAVAKPGIYKLPLGSKIQDVLIIAGGLSAKADREYLAKNFNLATKLTDGAEIYTEYFRSSQGRLTAKNIFGRSSCWCLDKY